MADAISYEPDRRELAHRSGEGIDVTLLWGARDGAIVVRVAEREAGRVFELDVAPDQALTAFNHPYAYAALREIHTAHALKIAA